MKLKQGGGINCINTVEITQGKEELQDIKPASPWMIMNEEAQNAIYVNFSRLFISDHDFILELWQQLSSPAEKVRNIVRIKQE